MKKNPGIFLIILAAVMLAAGGCAVIAGKEEGAASGPGLKLNYVETLRNEQSLRGEAYREVATSTDAATTLQHPDGVYADQFRVYVADRAPARVFIFDRGNRKVTILNGSSSSLDEVKLIAPAGIVVDAVGVIFVSDPQQGRVFGFDQNGKLSWQLGSAGALTSNQGLGDLATPEGMAIDNTQNRLYVADRNAHVVKVYSNMGRHLFDIGGSGKPREHFRFPVAVALDRAGNVHVLDSQRLRVFTFTGDGAFVGSFSLKQGLAPGMSVRPKGIAVDSDGHVYVTDAVNNNVLIFNPGGSFLGAWGRTGTLAGDFWTPTGIFIDSRDTIYIADETNGRIQVFHYEK